MKDIILYLMKFIGLFWLTRKTIQHKTLILSYHGFEVLNESSFRPKLFIKGTTLEKRLQYLRKHCNVIKLKNLGGDSKLLNSVVITIDDGWASTLTIAEPLFKQFDFPYTLYLPTENVLNNQPVFHVLIDYILLHSIGKTLSLLTERGNINGQKVSVENIPRIKEEIDQLKVKELDTELLLTISKSLDLDIKPIIDEKVFTLMSIDEVKEIVKLGADIQLHTHSHFTYLENKDSFTREILLNQHHIENIVGIRPIHHCYPSGSYNNQCIDWLKPLGIETATTCLPGFCDETSNKLTLPRFLDGENISQIVFEAEVSGVLELFRGIKKAMGR